MKANLVSHSVSTFNSNPKIGTGSPAEQLTTQGMVSLAKYNKAKQIIIILQKKVKKLQTQLVNNKIFLNMVIHDMRNPTNSIEFAVKEVLRLLFQAMTGGSSLA